MSVILTMEDVNKYVPIMNNPISVLARKDSDCTAVTFVPVNFTLLLL